MVCYAAVLLKGKLGYDDSLDAFGVHGVGGALGAILTGVFATKALTPESVGGGLVAGNTKLLTAQLVGIGAAAAYSAIVSFGILKLVDKVVGLRVDKDAEREGLDSVLHGETGYTLGSSTAHSAPAEEPPEVVGSPAVVKAEALDA
jgi:Amt family ammonium transporter